MSMVLTTVYRTQCLFLLIKDLSNKNFSSLFDLSGQMVN